MKQFFIQMLRTMFAIPLMIATTIVLYFGLEQSFFLSLIYSFIGITATYGIISAATNYYIFRKHHLTWKEYVFIKRNLREADKKIKRLYKALFSIHHLPSLKQRVKLVRFIRRIFKITKKEPRRFYQADEFYYKYLDSVVELTEKFVFLSSQPNKNQALTLSLHKTERALEQLTDSIEKELYRIIESDLDQLHFEIDVVNHTHENKNDR